MKASMRGKRIIIPHFISTKQNRSVRRENGRQNSSRCIPGVGCASLFVRWRYDQTGIFISIQPFVMTKPHHYYQMTGPKQASDATIDANLRLTHPLCRRRMGKGKYRPPIRQLHPYLLDTQFDRYEKIQQVKPTIPMEEMWMKPHHQLWSEQ